MIEKLRIHDIIGLYHQYSWVVNLPFIIYFGVVLVDIGRMKSEMKHMDIVFEKSFEESKILNQKIYKQYSYVVNLKLKNIDFYHSIKEPLDFVQSSEFVYAEDRKGEIDKVEKQVAKQVANMLYIKEITFETTHRDLNAAEKYPALRKYISSKYASQMISILASQMFTSNSCFSMCGYFYPIIQKYGDDYLLYPNGFESCKRKYSQIKINGNKIENNKYSFYPTHSGMHFLDIEYSYLFRGKEEVFRSRKGLLVK